MSTALYFITHEGIASNLITIGEAIIRKTINNLKYCEVPMDADIASTISGIEESIAQLDTDEGILFITDIYGSTPSNIAQLLADKYDSTLISGVNLPMVIRLLNYRREPEPTLIDKAIDGGVTGINQA